MTYSYKLTPRAAFLEPTIRDLASITSNRILLGPSIEEMPGHVAETLAWRIPGLAFRDGILQARDDVIVPGDKFWQTHDSGDIEGWALEILVKTLDRYSEWSGGNELPDEPGWAAVLGDDLPLVGDRIHPETELFQYPGCKYPFGFAWKRDAVRIAVDNLTADGAVSVTMTFDARSQPRIFDENTAGPDITHR